MKRKFDTYNEIIRYIYGAEYEPPEKSQALCRTVTFQVTDNCTACCHYCYQGNKGRKTMTKETAKKAVDLLFDMYDKDEGDFINKNTKAIILDFIGGEPLMNIEVIDYVCTYFMDKCIELNHPWLYTWRASMISNGSLYFTKDVQDFLYKFREFVSFAISLDGPKEIHDLCRVYPDGRGNFDDAYAAFHHFCKTYYMNTNTKVTISPENLDKLDTIIDFFVKEGLKNIHGNVVFEAEWTEEHGKIFYQKLKRMADYILSLDEKVDISFFIENFFKPLTENDNQNWCGGTGAMLAFDPDGIAYPCIRYMPSSLGDDAPPITIGTVDGIFETEEDKETKRCLDCITRRSQSTDECWNCPIASGCAWCSGWNYQLYGTPDKRCTRICPMHKARSLANVYYWNKYYHKNNMDKHFEMHLPKEEALKFISEDEYNMLLELSTK